MNNHKFINMLKALHFIDKRALPELDATEWYRFRSDPVKYLVLTDEVQQDAIMRELNKHV